MPRRIKARWIVLPTLVVVALGAMALSSRRPQFDFITTFHGQEIPSPYPGLEAWAGRNKTGYSWYGFRASYDEVLKAYEAELIAEGWTPTVVVKHQFKKGDSIAYLETDLVPPGQDQPIVPKGTLCHLTICWYPSWLEQQWSAAKSAVGIR